MNIPMPLTEEEDIVFQWQYQYMGGFYTTLMKAITLADEENLKKLAEGFPVYVRAYKRYSTESGWWDLVKEKVVALNKTGDKNV